MKQLLGRRHFSYQSSTMLGLDSAAKLLHKVPVSRLFEADGSANLQYPWCTFHVPLKSKFASAVHDQRLSDALSVGRPRLLFHLAVFVTA